MNKTAFSFIAIAILLFSSFIPYGNAIATKEREKTVEFPVKIYTLYGVKEIKKKLPIEEAIKLKKMAYEAGKAISMLYDKNASFMERMKANMAIDSFLHEMKKNGLLGSMSIKEAKELITGKYIQKHKSMEMKRLSILAKFLQDNGWKVNAICSCKIWAPIIRDLFPWNLPIYFLVGVLLDIGPILTRIALIIMFLFWDLPDIIPHFTTIGYWELESYAPTDANIWTNGLYGKESITYADLIKLITIGFTGIVFPFGFAMGFCPFIAMKKVE